MSLYKKFRVQAVIEETADCRTFLLATADGSPFHYSPGQFLTLVFPRTGGGEDRRSYSISSSPVLGEPLSITVKKVVNGAYSRRMLDGIKAGDELMGVGPSGYFILPEPTTDLKQLFFLAAGSGIVPIFSLIKTILHQDPYVPVVLIYSNRSAADTIFYSALKKMEKRFKGRLHIEWLFSSSPNLARARLGKWLLEILVNEYGRPPLDRVIFYLCGPFDYMRMATIQLLEEGVPARNIRKEYFETLPQDLRIVPPDMAAHDAEIRIDGATHHVTVAYPATIMQAARAKGIVLPYSCESGRCGTCAATCISGKVWMRYNEVLLDEEIAAGRVLTCVGYPIGGDVVISYV